MAFGGADMTSQPIQIPCADSADGLSQGFMGDGLKNVST